MSLAEFGNWADAPHDGPGEIGDELPRESGGYGGGYEDRRGGGGYGDGGYGQEDRGYDRPRRDPTPVPNNPPFVAYVGNLSYDTTADELKEFFSQACSVTSSRLIYAQDGQPKGFGYVEFPTRDDLVSALEANGCDLGSRRIKVDVSEQKEKPRSGFGGMGGAPRSDEPSEADTGPWRRGDKLAQTAPPPARGGGGSDFARRGGSDSFERRGDRVGDRGGDRGFERGSQQPQSRPRLNLQPRTKPLEAAVPPPADYSKAKSNPFGAAKPRDESQFAKKEEEKKEERKEERVTSPKSTKPAEPANAWKKSSDARPRPAEKSAAPVEKKAENRFAALEDE